MTTTKVSQQFRESVVTRGVGGLARLRDDTTLDDKETVARHTLEARVHRRLVLDRQTAHELGLEVWVDEEGD